MNAQPISNTLVNMGILQNPAHNIPNDGQTSKHAFQLQSSEATLTTTANTFGDRKTTSLTRHDAAKAVVKMNKFLAGSNFKTEFSLNRFSAIWINVVNKTTGKVVQKIPPETIRTALAKNDVRGLLIDRKQ